MIGVLCILLHVIREIALFFHQLCKCLCHWCADLNRIIVVRLVDTGGNVVCHDAILLIGVENGIAVPFIDLFCVGIAIGPVRGTPAQNTDLYIRVHTLRIRRQLPARGTGHVGILALIPNSSRIRRRRSITVISHLNFHVGY